MTLLVKILTVFLALTLVQSRSQRDIQLYLQKSADEEKEALLVMTWAERGQKASSKCKLFVDADLITVVLTSTNPPIRRVSEDEMENLLDDCSQIFLARYLPERDDEKDEEPKTEDETNESREYAIKFYKERMTSSNSRTASNKIETLSDAISRSDGLTMIFPGTKWCGPGDIAESYDDLGELRDTDRCCRAHDLCNGTIHSGQTKNGLTNNSPFTKLSCQCDDDLYDCLTRVNSVPSNTIGNIYFNIMRRDCYKEDYPFTKQCKRWGFLKISCEEYERDTNAAKVHQWFPAKRYKQLPIL